MKRRPALRESRLVHAAVGASILGVPASAAALVDTPAQSKDATGQTGSGTPIQAAVKSRRLPYGHDVVVTGDVPSPRSGRLLSATAGRRVRLQGLVNDRWTTLTIGRAGRLTVYQQSLASWYYDGGSTGCGFHSYYGVANVSLPCGTRVSFLYGGRTVTAVVDDRGPYVGGRTWDLNQNTAAALGFGGVDTVWSSS
jgi:rare lipoprotein A (peptidoglycan hydrolase)